MDDEKMALASDHINTGIVFVGTLAVCSLIYQLIRRQSRDLSGKKYAPSLPTLPLIGSIPFLPKLEEFHTFLTSKSEQLGRVFGMQLASYYCVVLNGRDAIHEALVKKALDFASRPAFPNDLKHNPRLSGIVMHEYNPDFRRYHQLSLSILKEFGFGQGVMETRIRTELDELVKELRSLNKKSVYPEELLSRSVLNVMTSILFSERYGFDDPESGDVISATRLWVRDSIDGNALNFLPALIHLPYYGNLMKRNLLAQDGMFKWFDGKISGAMMEDAAECFVKSFVRAEGATFDREMLVYTLRDLTVAGSETSATTLLWAFAMLANNPDIQKRLHAEIDSVFPRDHPPSYEDRAKLPYAEAAILELMRWKTIVPLALPHSTTCDTEVGGYFVPAKTTIFVNLYSAHMDPKVWHDPDVYNPERFLDESGHVINREQMITFSLGRRSCLGELLARQEVFLFFTGLLQQFQILPPEGQSGVEVVDKVGVTLSPSHYEVRFVPR